MVGGPDSFPRAICRIEATGKYLYAGAEAAPGSFREGVDPGSAIKALVPPGLSLSDLDSTERDFFIGLALRKAIAARVSEHRQAANVVLSLQISNSSFVAQQVADDLDLPHVVRIPIAACAFDSYVPTQQSLYRYLSRRAAWIVASDQSQERVFREDYGRQGGITTIKDSLDYDGTLFWRYRPKEYIRVVTDCGYSSREGTHLVIGAIRRLRRQGLDIRLSMAGPTDPGLPGPDYWAALRRDCEQGDGEAFSFGDHVPPERIAQYLLSGDIYCYASFVATPERPSRAMVIGMPIVATDTGWQREMCGLSRHVALCLPGDEGSLASAIQEIADLLRRGLDCPDRDAVKRWRSEVDPEKERLAWQCVFREFGGRTN